MKTPAHKHLYGPLFVHVETPKRACTICGFAVPARLVPADQIKPEPLCPGCFSQCLATDDRHICPQEETR